MPFIRKKGKQVNYFVNPEGRRIYSPVQGKPALGMDRKRMDLIERHILENPRMSTLKLSRELRKAGIIAGSLEIRGIRTALSRKIDLPDLRRVVSRRQS